MATNMTDEEYLQTQQQILLFAKLIVDIDLPKFIQRANTADTIGLFLMAPQEYLEGSKNLEVIRELASALLPFRREALLLREKVMAAGEELIAEALETAQGEQG